MGTWSGNHLFLLTISVLRETTNERTKQRSYHFDILPCRAFCFAHSRSTGVPKYQWSGCRGQESSAGHQLHVVACISKRQIFTISLLFIKNITLWRHTISLSTSLYDADHKKLRYSGNSASNFTLANTLRTSRCKWIFCTRHKICKETNEHISYYRWESLRKFRRERRTR